MPNLAATRNLIFRVAIPIPVNRLFDYRSPENTDISDVKPGIRLLVPFGKGKKIAYLVETSHVSERDLDSLKTVLKILDQQPLLQSIDIKLLHWASRYYHHPFGEVINCAFPVLLRKGKSALISKKKHYILTEHGRLIDPEQLQRAPKQAALLTLLNDHPQGINTQQLSGWNKNWRQPAKGLQEKGLLKVIGQPILKPAQNLTDSSNPSLQANQQQQTAIDAVINALGSFAAFLLEGVTGSGKTEVYMQIITQVLKQRRQVLVLLPEITLTPQLEARFRERFSASITVFHSALSETQRQNAWLEMQQGTASILLGTRSALFTPLKSPGLIIIDEEHDSSFKQQEGFRFSARDVAVVRAKNLQIPILMGSATPSLESLYNVQRKRYQLLHLSKRAGEAVEPALVLWDVRNKKLYEGLSDYLIKEIKQTLEKNQQVLLFLNRRGFAPTLICQACGWVVRCRRCEANLVVHFDDQLLRCHHCGQEQSLIRHCTSCSNGELIPLGRGTERIEKALTQLFPGEKIVRLDRDTTQRKGALEQHLNNIQQGLTKIILGTQMLAKGHHFPNVTLVALLDVDSGLFSVDFHAPEKLAQMIVQVSGRAGRAAKKGKVILQTRQPDHPLLNTLIKQGYKQFAQIALQERKTAGLPPFSHQALLRVLAVDRDAPLIFLQWVRTNIPEEFRRHTEILGPVAAPMARRAGRYRYQMLFQSKQRQKLHDLLDWLIPEIESLKEARKVRWSLDVDPVDLY
jgi:primosomal protein N' (replication factor Y) (superfamily II helicase)